MLSGQYEIGDVLGDRRYEIVGVLGEGNSGVTYVAEDLTQPGQKVALKVLSLHQAQDWKVLELFEREAQVLSRLRHPGIPRYLDFFQLDTERDRTFVLVQELATGKSLFDWVQSGWRVTEAGARQIAQQLLLTLVYLQKFDPPIIHRDLKPQNIIRQENGRLAIVDFGAVRDTYYSTLQGGSTVVGTYGYMAPEQFQGQAQPATDLYGLGATLLFLLTHRSPNELPQVGLKLNFRDRLQVSDQFADWLEKLLEPDPGDRFSSAQDALDALREPQPKIIVRSRQLSPQTALIGAIVAILAALWIGNAFKWRFLSTIGMMPRGICNNPSVLKDYLQHGGNPNAFARHSSTLSAASHYPLLFCVNSFETEKMLLDAGANPNTIVARQPILYNKGILQQNPAFVKLLLDKGANANMKIPLPQPKNPSYALPVLHFAAQYGQTETVALLIQAGAEINAKSVDEETALDVAMRMRQMEVIRLLLEKGAIATRAPERVPTFRRELNLPPQ